MKNIHSVLDSQETEAWQKLIRVLTHEIMNSITPVTSLSELLEHQIEDFDGNEEKRVAEDSGGCDRNRLYLYSFLGGN